MLSKNDLLLASGAFLLVALSEIASEEPDRKVQCARSWYTLLDKCYKLHSTLYGNFYESENACRIELAGELAAIKDGRSAEFVSGALLEMQSDNDSAHYATRRALQGRHSSPSSPSRSEQQRERCAQVWLAAKTALGKKNFVWLDDGSPLDETTSHWATGEPSFRYEADEDSKRVEFCIVMDIVMVNGMQ